MIEANKRRRMAMIVGKILIAGTSFLIIAAIWVAAGGYIWRSAIYPAWKAMDTPKQVHAPLSVIQTAQTNEAVIAKLRDAEKKCMWASTFPGCYNPISCLDEYEDFVGWSISQHKPILRKEFSNLEKPCVTLHQKLRQAEDKQRKDLDRKVEEDYNEYVQQAKKEIIGAAK